MNFDNPYIKKADTINISNGGTGHITYTNGELLIGKTNGTLAKRTLTPGSGIIITNGDGTIQISTNNLGSPIKWILQDVKSNGVHGGTISCPGWNIRTLNTLISSTTDTSVTLSSNQITLQPGKYFIKASAPAYQCGTHKIRLYNVTNNSTELVGTSECTHNDGLLSNVKIQTRSYIEGFITINIPHVYQIEHASTASEPTTGLGIASNIGVNEIYTNVFIEKLS